MPDAWNALFGPPGTPYFTSYSAGYYPGYTTGYRYGAYYAPTYVTGGSCCAPACNPCCSPCSPCGSSPCGVGNPCGITSASKAGGKLTPEKETNGLPKTFKGNGEEPPKPMGDSKFNKRDDTGKFQPTRKKEAGEFPGGNEAGKQKSFKGPENQGEPAESLIKKKKPAPAGPAKGDEEDPKKKEADTENGPRILKLNLDEKITWKAAPKRTRLVIRNTVAVPTVVRTKTDVNKRWTPVSRGTRIVRK